MGVLLVTALCAVTAGTLLTLRAMGSDGPRVRRAVIVDQLAATDPNETFVSDATTMLADAGYAVDYVPAPDVTVDFYRELPAQGYDVVILRSHSAAVRERPIEVAVPDGDGATSQGVYAEPDVTLFTNEPFGNGAHDRDVRSGQLGFATYGPTTSDGERFFGIAPAFIGEGTRGRFRGAAVILMGCGGLSSTGMAEAFVSKGADEFVSWDAPVTAEHTDRATTSFLRHWLVDGKAVAEAVEHSMSDVGPDPTFGARLQRYEGT
jgi:hypothetical protein